MHHVLIVDDETSIRTALRYGLEDVGLLVEEAADGAEGLQCILQSRVPLVVLLDLMMPKMDGISVLDALFKQPMLLQRHRVIVMSAGYNTLPTAIVRSMTQHHVRFIHKPFDSIALVALVEALAQELSPK
ncbi:MAG: response regulator [Ktedonobacterales bacterium]|nr:response regulator [Ktedonobacterales bacterium]